MPLQATSGAASYDAFGGGVPFVPTYIEDVFSTWLYTATASPQTITNGIDLAGEGGLVWQKNRSGTGIHVLNDTQRGASAGYLSTNNTDPQNNVLAYITSFNSDGFTTNLTGSDNFVTWTFRKQPKFFDVVTYTGNGANRTIAHNLGSAPGCVIVKCTSTTGQWATWHRSGTQLNNYCTYLNTTIGYADAGAGIWGANGGVPSMTSTTFSLGTDSDVNTNGETYVAYLFAHNAGGFGLTGTDNVISCGSYTGNSSTTGPTVTLGYEPQWVLIKDASNGSPDWWVFDNMRGVATGGVDMGLRPNTSGAEVTGNDYLSFNATGFQPTTTTNTVNQSGDTYIYIAIRRGPMKTPTSGTSVYTGFADSTASPRTLTTGFPVDLAIQGYRNTFSFDGNTGSRLQGANYLRTVSTTDELPGPIFNWDNNTAVVSLDGNSTSKIIWTFRRAPGFFDEVCYTGTGSGMTVAHNLAVAPELIINKSRSNATQWNVFSNITPSGYVRNALNSDTGSATVRPYLNTGDGYGLSAQPDATNIYWENLSSITGSGRTFVAYLFATVAGVSKVGSYTGTGTTQVINCGFTGGARFVMVKRTDSTGNWMVVDTARGLVSAGDPTLYLNSTAAEVTGVDWLDPDSSGFIVNNESTMNANTNGVTYIYLAIA